MKIIKTIKRILAMTGLILVILVLSYLLFTGGQLYA